MRRIVGGLVKWASIFVIIFLLVAIFGQSYLLEIPFVLMFGWLGFLRDNVSTMQFNVLLLLEGLICVVVLAIGGHYFARWLYRQMAPAGATAWRASWTASGLGAVLLLFVAGIATIGITHQTAWLFTAKQPVVVDYWTDRFRVSDAILRAAPARDAVTESFKKSGRLPNDAAEAGVDLKSLSGRHVKEVRIGRGGVVTIEVVGLVEEGEVALMPALKDGELDWTCRATLSNKVLPSACRR